MRRLFLCAAAFLAMTGLVLATEVTLIKFEKEKKEVTIDEGDEEKTYKITDKTKFFAVDKDGKSNEFSYEDAVKGLGNPKSEGNLRFDVTVKDGEVIEAKFKARKKNQ
jgi:cytochrome oxidase Cu insertion factor (SCO1/SenC/PrrC family)